MLRLATRPLRLGTHGGILVTDVDSPAPDREILRGGTTIGYLERLALVGTILVGQPAAIAVIVAIKGLGRFSELENAAARERFIIGTLASLAWAAACTGILTSPGSGLRVGRLLVAETRSAPPGSRTATGTRRCRPGRRPPCAARSRTPARDAAAARADPPGRQVGPVVVEADAQRDAEPRGAAREVGVGARRRGGVRGRVDALDTTSPARRSTADAVALGRADDVRAGVHAVGEVRVEPPGRAEHHRVALPGPR